MSKIAILTVAAVVFAGCAKNETTNNPPPRALTAEETGVMSTWETDGWNNGDGYSRDILTINERSITRQTLMHVNGENCVASVTVAADVDGSQIKIVESKDAQAYAHDKDNNRTGLRCSASVNRQILNYRIDGEKMYLSPLGTANDIVYMRIKKTSL